MQRGPQRRARISDVEKEAIIAWKNAGRTYAEIEGTFHHPISTLQNIVKRAEHQQQNRQRGRRKIIHPVAHAPYITQWLEDDCTITLGELSRRCQVRLGLEISRSTLCRALDQFNYSFKRVTVRDERGETEENNLRRFEVQVFLILHSLGIPGHSSLWMKSAFRFQCAVCMAMHPVESVPR